MSGAFFVLAVFFTFSFCFGYMVSRLLYKVSFIVLNFVFGWLLYETSNHPHIGVQHFILSLLILTFPMVLGTIIKKVLKARSQPTEAEVTQAIQQIANLSAIQVVQEIDVMLNCPIGLNNQWVVDCGRLIGVDVAKA